MRTRKSAEIRKQEIVEAALKLADRLGPDRLTTEAIARSIGLSQPGIFRHFPTKQALWEAVAADIAARMESCWARAGKDRASPRTRLRAVVAGQLKLIETVPAIPAILFSRELHSENSRLREALFALMTRFHGRLAGLLAEAREAGELAPEVDPGEVALLVLGLIQGLAVRWSLSGRSFDLTKEGERLLALQLSGFAPGGHTARGGAQR